MLREEKEKHQCEKRNTDQLPSVLSLTGDQTCHPGLCPDRESNWQPFGARDDVQPAVPLWLGRFHGFLKILAIF